MTPHDVPVFVILAVTQAIVIWALYQNCVKLTLRYGVVGYLSWFAFAILGTVIGVSI